MLTLSACVRSAVAEEGRRRRNRGGGPRSEAEMTETNAAIPELLGPIAGVRRKKKTRRFFCQGGLKEVGIPNKR